MKILLTTFYDPNHLGIRMLASVAKEAGHDVRILQLKDFRHKFLSPSDADSHTGYYLFSERVFTSSGDSEYPITDYEKELFIKAIREFNPDIIGFTLRSPYNHLLDIIIPLIRKASRHAFIIGGGFGPTYEPEISLSKGADAVICGEGEGALLDLVSALSLNKDWRQIDNIAYMDKGEIRRNKMRPLLQDLDSQPFPLYYGNFFISIEDNICLKEDMRYRQKVDLYNFGYTILTGRGCIANCSYCAGGNWRKQYQDQGLKAPRIRMRSLHNVMQELKIAKEHNETRIVFNDEYFIRPVNELINFFKEYEQNISIPFHAHLHHKQLISNNKLVTQIKKAGILRVPLGVQSASEEFALKIYNRKNNNKEILQCINICQQECISGNVQIIGANPLEKESDIEKLYEFCAQIPFDPSLKTRWFVHSAKLRILDGSPLAKKYPDLKKNVYPTTKYSTTILLAEIRNKVDSITFEKIRNDPFLMSNPDALYTLLHSIIKDLHYRYLYKEIERLNGRHVYFWGCGEMYKFKRHLFNKMIPECILVDEGFSQLEVDGLKVLHPDNILTKNNVLPIIIFSSMPHLIYRKIINKYSQYKDIVICGIL